MEMDLNEIKGILQNHLSDGLTVIVGSGLSCAEGMPGMGKLADHIIDMASAHAVLSNDSNWNNISKSIQTDGLEAAFLKHQLSRDMEQCIIDITADFLIPFETQILQEVICGTRKLRFTRLLQHLIKPNTGIPIVTPNYDRLIEVACEEAGLGVNTMFCGDYMGKLNERESRHSLCRDVKTVQKKAKLIFRDHARVYKPHGSFDWYSKDGAPVRYMGNLKLPRLIITPGVNKYRNGYESPFDRHREKANEAIDKASRYLIIGYGFNDDHLETRLKQAISSGKPTVLLTQKISVTALELISKYPSFVALEEAVGTPGTRFLSKELDIMLPGCNFWDLNGFIEEVLKP
ncbi:TPA: SIR2 family protein [Legionella pneumophila]|uniref:SIR2 family protein n=1 Tax=Legionella pneumophila TaxID=446 RepID=UPI001A32E725|nr:SIR2 family protein [Legionella pneumophila]MCZ4682219.1 SIR2 family protein [Legionella pneumophila]HAT3973801.1 SIR2 family protein [Legionella pneumophila]HAU0949052.1 SIR2 family protein [Legionella pneumophila]HAU1288258.1 SIR2 family protein [Legionella pneumophila]HAU1321399.1 SIR2 family protein [Legionella pneumophila]